MAATSDSAAVEFDPAALQQWLARHMPASLGAQGAMRVERIGGGQSNPTFFLHFDRVSLVMRKQPAGNLLPSAHAIDREYRVQRALHGSGVAVPEMLAYCDERQVIGTPFYVMRRMTGRIFPFARLTDIAIPERRAYFDSMAQTLAQLHNLDWRALGLADYGRQGEFYPRQLARWTRQWQASVDGETPEVGRLLDWFAAHLPADDLTTLVHGDFRYGNVMFHPKRPDIVAVLDWELSTLGHPLSDLAYFCMIWTMRPDEFDGLLDTDLAQQGLPDAEYFMTAYQRHRPGGPTLEPFHMAFALFRFAAILAGIAARARAGNAAGADAAAVGAQKDAFVRAAIAWTKKG